MTEDEGTVTVTGETSSDTLFDIYDRVKEHPSFVGGIIWDRNDVANALGLDDETKLTDEQLEKAREISYSFTFDWVHGQWAERLAEEFREK